MKPSMLPILCGAGLLISILPLTIILFWISKRGWLTLRLIAFLVFLPFSTIGAMFWFYLKDRQMLFIMLGVGSLASLIVLLLKFISPGLVKLIKIKW